MTKVIPMGGFRTEVREDRYGDGRNCFVASHPDLPGCVAYADTAKDALDQLQLVRQAYLADVAARDEAALPVTMGVSAHWQLSPEPSRTRLVISHVQGAAPALHTA